MSPSSLENTPSLSEAVKKDQRFFTVLSEKPKDTKRKKGRMNERQSGDYSRRKDSGVLVPNQVPIGGASSW